MIRPATFSALLAATTLAGTSAQAEVIQQSDTHFVSRHTVDVAAAPKDAWLALIAPGGWWNDAHTWSADASNMTLTPQAGGCFCERIPAEDDGETMGLEGSVQHMMVVQAVPRKVLRMRGGLGPLQSEPVAGVLTITMQPIEGADGDGDEANGTRIVWEYVVGGTMRFEVPQIAKAVDGVIGQQALGLAEKLGGPIVEAPEKEEEPEKAGEAKGPSAFDSAFGDGVVEDGDDETEDAPQLIPGKGR